MRIEVITDILSVKIVEADEENVYDVLFNQGYLVPFKFNIVENQFYVESVKKEALKEFKETWDQKKDLEALKELPKELEPIMVLYKKDPSSEVVDLRGYVLELLQYTNGNKE